MKTYCGIYQLVNKITNKRYIGCSINLKNREIRHFSDLRNKNHFVLELQNDFDLYGQKEFSFFIIERFEISPYIRRNPKSLLKLKNKIVDLEAIYLFLSIKGGNVLYNKKAHQQSTIRR